MLLNAILDIRQIFVEIIGSKQIMWWERSLKHNDITMQLLMKGFGLNWGSQVTEYLCQTARPATDVRHLLTMMKKGKKMPYISSCMAPQTFSLFGVFPSIHHPLPQQFFVHVALAGLLHSTHLFLTLSVPAALLLVWLMVHHEIFHPHSLASTQRHLFSPSHKTIY